MPKGICIKLKEDIVKLFRRVNLVYFRRSVSSPSCAVFPVLFMCLYLAHSTQYGPSLLTPSILSRAQKRSYASYAYTRTRDIWPSREALLDYEEALQLEAEVDALLEGQGASVSSARSRSTSSNPSSLSLYRNKTPNAPKKEPRGDDDLQRSTRSEAKSRRGNENGGAATEGIDDLVEDGATITRRRQNARAVKDVMERVYAQWLDMLNTKAESERPPSLVRFECGALVVLPLRVPF